MAFVFYEHQDGSVNVVAYTQGSTGTGVGCLQTARNPCSGPVPITNCNGTNNSFSISQGISGVTGMPANSASLNNLPVTPPKPFPNGTPPPWNYTNIPPETGAGICNGRFKLNGNVISVNGSSDAILAVYAIPAGPNGCNTASWFCPTPALGNSVTIPVC
jgi:hypothetical protein